jgi:hypothetical protein
MNIPAPDLTQRPPRSARVRLGGYVLLPRMLDKGRADIIGKNGEYKFACPLDQRILEFLGIAAEALRAELATGKGDGEILDWIQAHRIHQHPADKISAWSEGEAQRGPDAETRDFFQELLQAAGPHRTDISTWFDLLDLDDYVSYGGRA